MQQRVWITLVKKVVGKPVFRLDSSRIGINVEWAFTFRESVQTKLLKRPLKLLTIRLPTISWYQISILQVRLCWKFLSKFFFHHGRTTVVKLVYSYSNLCLCRVCIHTLEKTFSCLNSHTFFPFCNTSQVLKCSHKFLKHYIYLPSFLFNYYYCVKFRELNTWQILALLN